MVGWRVIGMRVIVKLKRREQNSGGSIDNGYRIRVDAHRLS